MEKDKSFTGPVFEKEEKRAVGRQFPLEANERRWGEGCPRSRDLRLVGEKRKHEQPVAVQCRVICLYSAVSGCATCWKPPYSTPDYTFAEIRTKYYAATWIRYRRTNLSLWQKRGISITLSLSLLLSCSLALSSSVHYARRPFVTHKLEWNDLGHWHKILSRFENSWWVNRVVNMPNWHVRCYAPFGNNHARTLCLAERFTSDRDGNCLCSMFY